MPAVMPTKVSFISKSDDQKKAILDALGASLAKVRVFGSYLMVGTYIKPERTPGGILLADNSRMEDLWQGSLGLVLKKGPQAFRNDGQHDFAGDDVKEGDWVLFRYSDGWEQHINGVSVRWVSDVSIKGVVDDPAIITSHGRNNPALG